MHDYTVKLRVGVGGHNLQGQIVEYGVQEVNPRAAVREAQRRYDSQCAEGDIGKSSLESVELAPDNDDCA